MIVGDIVYFNDIIFENDSYNDRITYYKDADHCFNTGRPCIYVGQIDDVMYFIPITGNNNFPDMDVCIHTTKSNRLTKNSYLVINNIICKEYRYFYTNGFINDRTMYVIFNNFINYYEEYNYLLRVIPNIDKIYILAIDYIDTYDKINQPKKHKKNKKYRKKR